MGQNSIARLGISAYIPWLQAMHESTHGAADYSAHFFRRAYGLLGTTGTVGFIATNSIAQGRTRESGLKRMIEAGARIYNADCNKQWQGKASVTVSTVHLAKSHDRIRTDQYLLNGIAVSAISSWLQVGAEIPVTVSLRANNLTAFLGSNVYGSGFVLTPKSREDLIKSSSHNDAILKPYIGGDKVNTSPSQAFARYVIDFGDMTLAQAENWPHLLKIVREKVKSERDKNNTKSRRFRWWQFAGRSPELYQAINQMQRCLVSTRITKHLCFSFQPIGRVYSDSLVIFALDTQDAFAVLQSRIHEFWARQLCSTMGGTLRYVRTDCFRNFPFPHTDPRARDTALEAAGQAYYTARADYMQITWQGLTKTYNAMTDPSCQDARVLHLRHLHEQTDRAVLAAYGWSDITVPPYCPTTPAAQSQIDAFKAEIFRRLLALNQTRAHMESAGTI